MKFKNPLFAYLFLVFIFSFGSISAQVSNPLIAPDFESQQEWVVENEGLIWNYIIQNENLYSIDPVVIQIYIGESPFTQNMPQASPGNIGQWVGWQVVKEYMSNNPKKPLTELMAMSDAQTLFKNSNYKPQNR